MTPEPFAYRPALDGVRAFAVLAVLAIHGFTGLEGGFVGVDMFFVLSGFLITGLMLAEWESSGSVALASFYARRIRRLVPALLVLILGVGVLYASFRDLDRGIGYGKSTAAVVSYVGNWIQGYHQHATQGRLGLFDPTWSLAIEEQFYLTWPLALLVLMRRGVRPSVIVGSLLGLAAISASLRIVTWYGYLPGSAYFDTHTHADGLLLGCALGVLFSTPTGRSWLTRHLGRDAAALSAMGVLVVAVLALTPLAAASFVVGIAAVNAASFALIGHLAIAPHSEAQNVFGWSPLVWIGTRSYGIYLFHWPIFSVVTPARLHVNWSFMQIFPVRAAIVFAMAALSYRFVERRFLRRSRDRRGTQSLAEPRSVAT